MTFESLDKIYVYKSMINSRVGEVQLQKPRNGIKKSNKRTRKEFVGGNKLVMVR